MPNGVTRYKRKRMKGKPQSGYPCFYDHPARGLTEIIKASFKGKPLIIMCCFLFGNVVAKIDLDLAMLVPECKAADKFECGSHHET
jgi:hypothetical protein